MAGNANLECFFCAGNFIGDDGAQALGESLEHNTTLLQLSLKGTALDTKLFKDRIKKLLLTTDVHIFFACSGNQINAKGAQALAKALKHNKSLTHLNLDSTWLFNVEFAFYIASLVLILISFLFYSWIGGK